MAIRMFSLRHFNFKLLCQTPIEIRINFSDSEQYQQIVPIIIIVKTIIIIKK